MSRAPDRVRCYNCGRPQSASAPLCTRCGATFRALCACTADLSVYDPECAACGAAHVVKRLPAGRHPYVRAVRWTLLSLAALVAAYEIAWPRPLPLWKIKAQAADAFNAAVPDYTTAANKYRQVAEQSPDAESYYMLALCYQKLGHPPETYMEFAGKALVLSPGMFAAHMFLAQCELDAGRTDRALEHAEAAVRSTQADGRAYELLAEVEISRPQPNLPRVQAALEQARASGRDTARVRILLAEVSMRLYGVLAARAGSLPPGVSVQLNEAVDAFDKMIARESDPVPVLAGRARVLLALGRSEEAYTSAVTALGRLPAGAPAARVAELRTLKAMALHSRGNRADAMADFADALRLSPTSQTAAAATAFLLGADDGEGAQNLLSDTITSGDPSGDVRAVLAGLLLARAKDARDAKEAKEAKEAAAAHIRAARNLAPGNASFAEIEGAVLAALGKTDEARTAYAEASRLAPQLVGPKLRLALVDVDAAGEQAGAKLLEDAERQLAALLAESGEDPRVLTELGRIRLLAGESTGAAAVLEKAKDASPADGVVWRLLGDARRRVGGERAFALAGDAYARARALSPNDASILEQETGCRLDDGKAGAAVAACTEFLQRHPGDVVALALRARAYGQLAMWSPAASDLTKAHELAPANELVVRSLVEALYRSSQADAARRVIEECLPRVSPETAQLLTFIRDYSLDPDAAMAALSRNGASALVADVQLQLGRPDDAIVTLRAYRKDHPEDARAARLLVLALLDTTTPDPARLSEARAVAASLTADAPRDHRAVIRARLLLADGDFAGAAAEIEPVCREMPEDPFAAMLRGEALFRAGERAESLASFRRVATIPGAPPAMRGISAARILSASRGAADPETAESLAREALVLAPGSADAVERVASLLLARGDAAGAAGVAEQTLAAQALPAERVRRLLIVAANARVATGQYAIAQTHLDRLAASGGETVTTSTLRGFALLGAGRTDEADAAFQAVLAGDPNQAIAQIGRIDAALLRGRADAAEALCAAWMTGHPADRAFLVQALRRLARNGGIDAAVALARSALAASPGDAMVGAELARLLTDAGRADEAVAAFRSVTEHVPAASRAVCDLALGTFCLSVPGLAQESLTIARRVASEAAAGGATALESRVLEAAALLALGRRDEAEAAARAVAKRWDGSTTPADERTYEARIRFVIGSAACAVPSRLADAIEQLLLSVRLDDSNVAARNNLAWAFGRRQDTAARGAALAKQVTLESPANPGYWDTRASCSAAAGDPDDAVASWRRSLELYAKDRPGEKAARAATAQRCAEYLVQRKREGEARQIARAALEYAAGTPSEASLRKLGAD